MADAVTDTIDVPWGSGRIVYASGSVWVHGVPELYEVDPSSGRTLGTFPVFTSGAGGGDTDLDAGEESVWATSNPAGGFITRIDVA